jgi:hypothetical protein
MYMSGVKNGTTLFATICEMVANYFICLTNTSTALVDFFYVECAYVFIVMILSLCPIISTTN